MTPLHHKVYDLVETHGRLTLMEMEALMDFDVEYESLRRAVRTMQTHDVLQRFDTPLGHKTYTEWGLGNKSDFKTGRRTSNPVTYAKFQGNFSMQRREGSMDEVPKPAEGIQGWMGYPKS